MSAPDRRRLVERNEGMVSIRRQSELLGIARSGQDRSLAAANDNDAALDRLARSTRDLLNILDTIGKVGAGFKSLSDTWADTTTPHRRLMLTVVLSEN